MISCVPLRFRTLSWLMVFLLPFLLVCPFSGVAVDNLLEKKNVQALTLESRMLCSYFFFLITHFSRLLDVVIIVSL